MFNFKYVRKMSVLPLLAFVLSACSTSPEIDVERVPDQSPQARYQEAKRSINNEMYTRAITMLSDLETRYPFGPLSRQVQLDLIFAYYKSGRLEEALQAIDRFTRLNPNHPQLDYVLYMRGLVNMDTGINGFQEFFGIENADKDMEAARAAFSDFKKLILTYPSSKYIPDSKKRMSFLLDKMARQEIVIAEYYMRRAAYVAALNRCKYILEYYQHSSSVKPALEIMAQAYEKLGLTEMQQDTLKVIAANHS